MFDESIQNTIPDNASVQNAMSGDESVHNTVTEEQSSQAPTPKTELPPVIDGRVDITYDTSGMLANLIIYPAQNGGRPVNMEFIANELLGKGIVACVDEFDIRDMLDNRVYETPVCVARAIPAKNGQNGSVDYKYEKNRVLKPKAAESGEVDFRELDTIVKIRKGDIIAEIIPPTEGEAGLNIFGESIPPQPGTPAKPTVGKNSVISADGKYIIAACDGHIVYGVGCFNVEDTVTIRSDLDFSVGNLDFFGDIVIKGNVMEGFSIKAGRNIKIDGSVFSSTITAGGSINVVGGLINSTVECEGNVTTGFCQSSKIKAKGNVESKEFAFCEVFCYGELIAKGSNGTIVGGNITSMRDVTANVIGSEKYTHTVISIGDCSVTFARKRKAETELEEYDMKLQDSLRNLTYLKEKKIQQGGVLSDEQQRLMKSETQNKIFCTLKKKELNILIAQLEEDIKNRDNLCAKCSKLFPGTRFCINFLTLDITQIYGRSRVAMVDDQIMVMSN
ncbi:MAG: FapA family protein [Oscillospiraceae bacterium]